MEQKVDNMANKNIKKLYDRSFRNHLINNPSAGAQELGYPLLPDTEVKVVVSTKDVFYVALFSGILEESLKQVMAAGVGTSTVGCAGTASSISTFTSSVGSAGSAGTLGCAGSVKIGT